jgi:cysteine desulfurase family protein
MIYMDNAATSLHKPPQVEQAVIEALHVAGNPGRGAHKGTLDAGRIVYSVREKLAHLFNIDNPSRIAFTSNATEALNIAIRGMFHGGDHIITTVCEHNSVLRPLYLLEKEGVQVTYVHADSYGIIDYEEMENSIQPDTKAVIVTYASNLTGNLTDMARVSSLAGKYGIKLIVDASQTAGVIPIDVEKYGIDVMCFTGHKGLMGPQGTGGIYVKNDINIRPLKVGGSGIHSYDREHPADMPEALEAGTLNTHGIAGLGGALSYIEETGIENIRMKELELVRHFTECIKDIPGIKIYGNPDIEKRVGIVSVNLGDTDSSLVSDWLWEDYGICVRPGAHCAPLMHKALHTVEQGAVRFSFSYFNTFEEVDIAVSALKELA